MTTRSTNPPPAPATSLLTALGELAIAIASEERSAGMSLGLNLEQDKVDATKAALDTMHTTIAQHRAVWRRSKSSRPPR